MTPREEARSAAIRKHLQEVRGQAQEAPNRFCLGLDLGRQVDPSALAVLRWKVDALPNPHPIYEVPTLQRWPLGTPYRQIVTEVARFLKGPPFCEHWPVLVLDSTGVGEAVAEMCLEQLREEGIRRGGMITVVITSGAAVTKDDKQAGRWRVAKKQLASVLQVLLGHDRLRIAPRLREARTLKEELGKFSVKITEALNETYEAWRESDHDDLVLACALSAWCAETLPGVFEQPPPLRPLQWSV